METRCEYLRPLVEGCPGRMVDDKKFLQGAQPAGLGDRVVGGSPAQDVPCDGVRDVGVLQVPNVSCQLRVTATFPVGEVMFVSPPSHLEVVPCQSTVSLDVTIVIPHDLGLIHDALHCNTTKMR